MSQPEAPRRGHVEQEQGDDHEPEDGPRAEVRVGTMSPEQARIARHNWIMMHPNATSAERREAEADLFGRITR